MVLSKQYLKQLTQDGFTVTWLFYTSTVSVTCMGLPQCLDLPPPTNLSDITTKVAFLAESNISPAKFYAIQVEIS